MESSGYRAVESAAENLVGAAQVHSIGEGRAAGVSDLRSTLPGDSLQRLVGAVGTRGAVAVRARPGSPARAGNGCRPRDSVGVAAGAPISADRALALSVAAGTCTPTTCPPWQPLSTPPLRLLRTGGLGGPDKPVAVVKNTL